jgi:glycosyltransferase involved in cell wall biosynthesis
MSSPPSFIEASPKPGRPQLLCFSHLRWNFVYQRPQHILTAASQQFDVLYIEEPRYEKNCRARIDAYDVAPGLKIVVPVLPEGMSAAEAPILQRCLVSALLRDDRPALRVKWYYTPMALAFSSHVPADVIVYDCMDELSNFHGAPDNLRLLERELLEQADIVFTGGRSLFEAKEPYHHNIHCFPSSIDAAHFGKAQLKSSADPADQTGIAHPRVGFFGVIDERFDVVLVGELAAMRPDLQFVMLGPVVKIDPATLPQAENIHWLGGKSYEQLPAYLAHWDAGFMPFAINAATRFISPTKTPEFLAAGLPVVSTPVRDVVSEWGRAKLVAIASTAQEMSRAIDGLLDMDRIGWMARVNQKLATMSWANTWDDMLSEIRDALPHGKESQSLPLATPAKLRDIAKEKQRAF